MLEKSTVIRRFAVMLLAVSLTLSAIPMYAAQDNSTQAVQTLAVTENVSTHAQNIILTAGKDDTCYNLTWMTSANSTESVQWVESEKVIDGVFPEDCYSNDSIKNGSTCSAQITGLEANTEYSYRVGNNGIGWTETYTLTTGDFEDTSFSFLFVGDPQVGVNGPIYDGDNWNITLDKAQNWFGEDVEFLMSAGDQVNDNTQQSHFDAFASPEWLRSLPLITTVGNHDNGPSYSKYFTYTDVDQDTLSNAGEYGGDYWVEYDGVLIVNLNTNRSSVATHKAFLEKAIAEYTEAYGDPVWKIVTFHHSFYSAADGRAEERVDQRTSYSSVFSELGIDAVLMGHDHIYTRAYMIDGNTILDDPELYNQVGDDPYGSFSDPSDSTVFYLTANSSSGSKFYGLSDNELPYVACKNQENTPNFTKVDVTADSLQFTTYRSALNNDIGDVVDFFAIHRTEGIDTDNYAPTLNVPLQDYYYASEEFDTMAGITAYDNHDGDITDKIVVTGDINTRGTSILTYTVTDAAGNTTVKERTLICINSINSLNTENTTWKYLDDGTFPFEFDGDQYEWITEDFDDSQWKEAKGPFGSLYGELGDHNGVTPNTLINLYFPEGSDEEGSHIPNYFFRTEFDLEDPEMIDLIIADLWYDDAVLIYINGVKIKDFNVGGVGNVGYSSNNRYGASTYGSFEIKDPEVIASLNLKETGNVLAVELFQGDSSSEDIFFDFTYLRFANTVTALPFEDVKPESWYYNNVSRAYSKGLFAGVTETTFEPKSTMTRAMVWTILAKMEGVDLSGGEKWYSKAQEWAVANGVSDGTYPSKNNITREQLVTMLYSISGKPQIEGNIDSFTDKDTASAWAIDALVWAVQNELMVGRGDAILAPRADLTRAEACTLILKYLDIK